ncbi:hypothetical protein [Microbulbifer sp. GL-2]|uniref:hypothetical protein n=1 Tax=Microbulbifer sp. GL-2 TaxID=2591606 RepID=UPI001164F817|nr:hypothetical protein [Microbulbifer sp. GL-2]BBM03923.1 hypothetical protein GL2_39970 [Microbulbifer sp. GL-2]
MALIKYPAELPAPQLDGYALKKVDNRIRTEMASGRARQRRRFARVPTELSVKWKLLASEAAIFEGFITHGLSDAMVWFSAEVLTPQGLLPHKMRFITDPLSDCRPLAPHIWEYSARIEIEDRIVLTEEQTVAGLLAPNTIQQFSRGVDRAVDSYQE